MSPRTQAKPAPRRRRTHAERTAETRQRIMDAVVESISEVGYPRTTALEIARRAGVTWGAVQHHFGDKDGILLAVLEASFAQFADIVGDAPPDDADLEKRVGLFVDRSWEHFGSPHFRSTLEILTNLPPDPESRWQQHMLGSWFRIWSAYFPSSRPRRRRTIDIMRYTISVFSGLATTQMLEGADAVVRATELGFLKDTLVREIANEG